MNTIPKKYARHLVVNSTIGRKNVDSEGSPISGVRIDPSTAYDQIYTLLQRYITQNDETAWQQLTDKID